MNNCKNNEENFYKVLMHLGHEIVFSQLAAIKNLRYLYFFAIEII